MSFLKKIKNILLSGGAEGRKEGLRFIQTQAALKEACKVIAASPWAAIDAEADSLHHYVEKLCLLQVSVKGGDYVIDPLIPLDLTELARTLEPKSLLFHGADFDIRMLKKTAPFMPKQMFDTMLAAQILGYEKFGLADLANKICGVKLSKSAQKADWSRRPLTPDLLEYAAGDTKYLERIYTVMKKELQKLGRFEWHKQACDRLLASLNSEAPREEDPLRWQLRGSRDLSGRGLTTLRLLWQWRESEAQRMDRPSFKVLNTDYLLMMARWAEQNPDVDIIEWKEAPRHIHRQYREKLNKLLREAQELPETIYSQPEKSGKGGRRLRSSEEARFARLKEERLRLSQKLKIQASVLGTNSILEEIVRRMPKDLEEMRSVEGILPWQAEALAPTFVKILHPEKK